MAFRHASLPFDLSLSIGLLIGLILLLLVLSTGLLVRLVLLLHIVILLCLVAVWLWLLANTQPPKRGIVVKKARLSWTRVDSSRV